MSQDRTFQLWAAAGLVCLPPAFMWLVARKLTSLAHELPSSWDLSGLVNETENMQQVFWADVTPSILCAIIALALAFNLNADVRPLATGIGFGVLGLVSAGSSCLWFVSLSVTLNSYEDEEFPTFSLLWAAVGWALVTTIVAGFRPGRQSQGRNRSEPTSEQDQDQDQDQATRQASESGPSRAVR